MMPKRAIVIGGGISGLSVAYFLSQKAARENLPLKITILEAEDRFGGVLRTLRTRDFHMEAGADAFDGRDPEVLAFCRDLGLQKELVPCEPILHRIFIFQNGKFFPFDFSKLDPWAVFRYPALSLNARARLLFEGLIPAKRNNDDETIADFVKRRAGAGFLKELAGPLVRGVLMGEAEKLSAHEYFPQWVKMERTCGSLSGAYLKKKNSASAEASFSTLRGGLDRLAGALLKRLEPAYCDSESQVISLKKDKLWKVFLRDGRMIEAEIVCIALPAPEASKILMAMVPQAATHLARIRYDSLAVVSMIFRRDRLPSNFPQSGFIVPPRGPQWPFASLKLIGNTEDGKFTRLRAFISKAFQPEIFGWEDGKIQREVLRFIDEKFDAEPPFWVAVERYPEALPQYERGHAVLVSSLEKLIGAFPGLTLAGNGYHGFGISDCIRTAQRAVQGIKLL